MENATKKVGIVKSPEVVAKKEEVLPENVEKRQDGLLYNTLNGQHYTDYAMRRKDKTIIIVRELEEKGMPKIGLKAYRIMYELDQLPTQSNSRIVYSEGIDFEKMMQDLEYLKTLQDLLDEPRMNEKTVMAKSAKIQNGAAYIGQVYQKNGKYCVMTGNINGGEKQLLNKIAEEQTINER